MENSNQLLKTQLMKVQALYLSIPKPCHEDWDKMTPTEKGRHCLNCQKEVVDFTAMSDQEILAIFSKNKTGLCGRFHTDQLNRQMLLRTRTQSTPWARAGILAASLLLAVPAISQQILEVRTEQQEEKYSTEELEGKHTITGRVLDEEGEPLIAATIITKSKSVGTVTDLDGRFTLHLSKPKDTLVVSYIGYQTQEVAIPLLDANALDITLIKGVELEEVVVKGYQVPLVTKGYVVGSGLVYAKPRTIAKRIPKFATAKEPEIKVYPNPFVSQIQIEIGHLKEGNYTVRIVANTGQIVHQLQLFFSSHQRLEMDLAALNLTAGTYWLQISDGKEQNFKQQLIKINR